MRRAGDALLASRFGSAVMRRSGTVSSIGYTAGNAVILLKDAFTYNAAKPLWSAFALKNDLAMTYDMAAGGFFLACSAALALADSERWRDAGFRIVGGTLIAGSAIMAYGALNPGQGMDANWSKFSGTLVQIAIGGTMLFQKEIANLAEAGTKRAKSVFNRAAGMMAQYPVIIAAAMDAAASTGLLIGAFQDNDAGMKLAMSAWGVGVTFMCLTDPRLKDHHKALVSARACVRPT